MIWKPGQILRIKSYQFEDDGSTRDKYAIVLYTNENEAYLIHCLTTSQNNISVPVINYGCSIHHHLPYYFIPQGHVIGNEGYFFDKDTFIFFRNNVRKEAFSKMELAAKTLFGVISLGVCSHTELKRIIKCALKSNFIPQEIEKELSIFKDSL